MKYHVHQLRSVKNKVNHFQLFFFNETSQNGYSKISKTLIGNKQCIKEDIPTIYQIIKNRPEVECFEVTPESSPETGVSYITATEEEEIGPKQIRGTFCKEISFICKKHGEQTQTKV